jgi:hypothetical protein
MTRQPVTRRAAIFVALVLAITLGAFAPAASAHTGGQSYLYLDVTPSTLSGRVEMPVGDMRQGLGLTLDGTDDELLAEVTAERARIEAYLLDNVSIGVAGQAWPMTYDGVELLFEGGDDQTGNYVIFPFTVAAPVPAIPRELEVTFEPFFDEIDDRDALVLIGNDWEGGVIENVEDVLQAFTPEARTQTVDLGSTAWHKTVGASITLGVDHIKTGPDHILFVLVLLLPSVLVFSTAWWPAQGFTTALWRVLKVVSMFTVAHTITFTLAGLDILPLPPSKLVESIIAISIAAAALHNLRPIAKNKEWLISFLFGLFHGMGFASLVEDLEVSRSTQLLSLLGRNLGIEIGQAGVVLLAFPALFLLRRTRYYQPIFTAASVLLAVVSLGWMIERVFERDLKVSNAVDPVVEWPRSFFAMVLVTVLAGVAFWWERQRSRLLPVGPAGEPEREPAPA